MVRVIEDYFPFVFAIVAGDIVDADVDLMYARYRALHARKERFYLAQDVRQVNIPGAAMRKRLGQLNLDFSADIAARVPGVGIIVSNRLAVGAMTALYWVSRENSPTRYFASGAECMDFADTLAAPQGLAYPAGTRAALEQLDTLFKEKKDLVKHFRAGTAR